MHSFIDYSELGILPRTSGRSRRRTVEKLFRIAKRTPIRMDFHFVSLRNLALEHVTMEISTAL